MKLNELFINQESIVKKEIILNGEKCELTYMKDMLNKYAEEVFLNLQKKNITDESILIANIKIKDLEYKLYCEAISFEKNDISHRFEVYVEGINGENYCRTDYIAEVLCEPIKNEEELIQIIVDLMDYTMN